MGLEVCLSARASLILLVGVVKTSAVDRVNRNSYIYSKNTFKIRLPLQLKITQNKVLKWLLGVDNYGSFFCGFQRINDNHEHR